MTQRNLKRDFIKPVRCGECVFRETKRVADWPYSGETVKYDWKPAWALYQTWKEFDAIINQPTSSEFDSRGC